MEFSDSLVYFVARDNCIVLNKKEYRNFLIFKRVASRTFLINVLPVEDYLKGVVPSELGMISEAIFEAIIAQTVAARTYAYAHRNYYESLGFDLYGTVQDQVYDGMNVEKDLVNKAIKKTKGLIITYQGKPIEAKYHSTCGGRTANYFDIWADTVIPYLVSIDDRFCSRSPHAIWSEEISFSKLMNNLGSDSLRNEKIKKILLKRNPQSGRVIEITVITNLREEKITKGKIRRTLVGENLSSAMLKSSFFDMEVINGKIKITGRGYGHGVGMCQYGAIGMARQGYSYKQILKRYYPQTKLIRKKF